MKVISVNYNVSSNSQFCIILNPNIFHLLNCLNSTNGSLVLPTFVPCTLYAWIMGHNMYEDKKGSA